MNAPVSRRSLLQAGGATLGATMIPVSAIMPFAVEVPATGLPASLPLAFDPAMFIADLKAAGYGVVAYRAVPRGGELAEPPGYFIRPLKGRGFGDAYTTVMAKWWDAIETCPDHAERVAVHVLGQIGRTA